MTLNKKAKTNQKINLKIPSWCSATSWCELYSIAENTVGKKKPEKEGQTGRQKNDLQGRRNEFNGMIRQKRDAWAKNAHKNAAIRSQS